MNWIQQLPTDFHDTQVRNCLPSCALAKALPDVAFELCGVNRDKIQPPPITRRYARDYANVDPVYRAYTPRTLNESWDSPLWEVTLQ
ncbi:Peptide chain release factor 1, partial [Clarias magur]